MVRQVSLTIQVKGISGQLIPDFFSIKQQDYPPMKGGSRAIFRLRKSYPLPSETYLNVVTISLNIYLWGKEFGKEINLLSKICDYRSLI